MKLTTKQRHAKAIGPRRCVFPAHLASTPSEWRALKRQEWREVMQALERYAYGAAYTPAQAALYSVGKLARQVNEAVTAADWVAW